MKTKEQYTAEIMNAIEATGAGHPSDVVENMVLSMLREVWLAATKAQRDAIVENAGGDYLWPDEIEDVPLAPFPDDKPKEDKLAEMLQDAVKRAYTMTVQEYEKLYGSEDKP